MVSPGSSNDVIIGIASIFVLLISCGLAFGILTSFLVHDKKKGYFFIVYMVIGATLSLIGIFRRYTALGIAALVIYIAFSILTYILVKRKKSRQ